MGEWFQSLLDGVWDFFTFFWDVLLDAGEKVGELIGEWLFFLLQCLVFIPKFFWESFFVLAIRPLLDQMGAMDFSEQVSAISLKGLNVGGLLAAIVDLNYLLLIAGSMGAMVVTAAIIKFTIKLIPGIG